MEKAYAGTIQLIVGLGNPGREYANTRHNAGAWFIEQLASAYRVTLKHDKKFFGHTAQLRINGQPLHLLCPGTFMNCSGQSVAAMARFYRIEAASILIAHDELAFPAGIVRFKQGGSHGGHNGLRDIIARLGNQKDFLRLRLGIDHPGNSRDVTGYVLKAPSKTEASQIDSAIHESIRLTPDIIQGSWQSVMRELHSFGK